jgi:putative transposase
MARLQHLTAPGCTYFVTTKAVQNVALFRVHQIAEIVVAKLLHYRDAGAYLLHEFVLMPNHLHLLLTPNHSTTREKAMQLIKGGSSHEIHKQRGNKTEIWQAGFHEATVRDPADYLSRVRYIHQNPIMAALAEIPQDWPWSSASLRYRMDQAPDGLKPNSIQPTNVGAKAPTP